MSEELKLPTTFEETIDFIYEAQNMADATERASVLWSALNRTPAQRQPANGFTLRWAIETVLKTFRDDEAAGYRSKARQYAISILGKAIEQNQVADTPGRPAGIVGFADIEGTIVEYLSAAGFDVVETGADWIAHIDEAEINVTALATAVAQRIVAANRHSQPVTEKRYEDRITILDSDFESLMADRRDFERLRNLDIMHEAAQKLLSAERDALLDQVEELKTCLHDFVFKEAVCDQTIERAKRLVSEGGGK